GVARATRRGPFAVAHAAPCHRVEPRAGDQGTPPSARTPTGRLGRHDARCRAAVRGAARPRARTVAALVRGAGAHRRGTALLGRARQAVERARRGQCPAAAGRGSREDFMTLNASIPTTRRAAPRAVPRRAGASADALRACAALGDAAALVRRDDHRVAVTTPPWRALLPSLSDGAAADALELALPGLRTACRNAEAAPQRLTLGPTRQWDAQLALHDDDHLLLRVSDRRELGRAVQRQLDDREQLLFTSRVISVGEMATTLAHELNQPIGAAANLLRGLRSR